MMHSAGGSLLLASGRLVAGPTFPARSIPLTVIGSPMSAGIPGWFIVSDAPPIHCLISDTPLMSSMTYAVSDGPFIVTSMLLSPQSSGSWGRVITGGVVSTYMFAVRPAELLPFVRQVTLTLLPPSLAVSPVWCILFSSLPPVGLGISLSFIGPSCGPPKSCVHVAG